MSAALALYMFNLCVDTTDLKPRHLPEDLSINDQESVIELIVEKVLGYEEAIAEYDEHDAEDHNLKKHSFLDYLYFQETAPMSLKLWHAAELKFKDLSNMPSRGFYQILIPPPRI